MGNIYRHAKLTIAVISAATANDNIPGILPESRHPLPMTQLWSRHLFGCPVDLYLQLSGTKYESRAWTMQERLLSKGCLYVTNNSVYYQCLQDAGSELCLAPSISSYRNPLHLLHSLNRNEALVTIQHSGLDVACRLSDWVDYHELVRKYSQREMAYSSDILCAFGGIMAALASRYDT